ncbi:MAG: inorganic diphosphatase [Desulfuromonas sp.]|nr:MAG: inorganic diphosphatase [Desulfuromonas sp.]
MAATVTYVIGHKNPDTDSVCSAIAYARLRYLQGVSNIEPARAGDLNRQTDYILETLGVSPPTLLADVYPRVRDVISDKLVTIPPDAPLSEALQLFHQHNIRLLPVVDATGAGEGMLVLKRLSDRFLVPSEVTSMRQVLTSPAALARALKAKVLHQVEEKEVAELDLYVGAMASSTFADKMADVDPRRTILITGDRENVQRLGVERGVRALIVTGDLPVASDLVELAREKGVTLLSTPYDTANSAWLARLSTPVAAVSDRDHQTVKPLERLDDLRLKLMHGGDPGVIVLDEDEKVIAVATKSNLLAPSRVQLVLVDHNELSQAVAGAEKVEIVEIVDHHRLGNPPTDQPIRFLNMPVGSTCSVVATQYRQCGREPDAETASLLLAGLLSDTVILRSPTTTDLDRELAVWLGQLSGRQPESFGRDIFAASSALRAYPTLRELLLADFKEYHGEQESFGVGQVEVVSFHEFQSLKEELGDELKKLRDERKLDMAALLVTDIVQETSLLLACGSRDLPFRIGYPQLEENLYELKGVLSRKKQLLPHLLKVFKG